MMERENLPIHEVCDVDLFGKIYLLITTNKNMTPLQIKIENDIKL